MKKVIIGILSKHYINYKNNRTDTYIRDEVKQAIFDNGAIAIGILQSDGNIKRLKEKDIWKNNLNEKEYENLICQINLCDGIIFQGGAQSDNYECIAAKYCYENNIPSLGICAGQNVMARAMGGSIYKIDNKEKHLQNDKQYVHNIKINRESKFYNIIKKDEIMVNSRHMYAVKECPKLDKVAFCEDGYADVIEAKDKKFFIGVKFHPESLYKIDENMNSIFKKFINVCENNSRKILN